VVCSTGASADERRFRPASLRLQWARERFNALFVDPPTNVNLYLSQPNFVETTLKHSGQTNEQLNHIHEYLVAAKPISFEECVAWARLKFEHDYASEIKQLLTSMPKDAVTSTGALFWSGPKRAPDALEFNAEDVRDPPCAVTFATT
jgi:ubiquitin-activating enzyme E1